MGDSAATTHSATEAPGGGATASPGTEAAAEAETRAEAGSRPTLAQLVGYFLRLGTTGFGGPVALVGFMHRDLVERRRWISEETYALGLALAQIMPGRHARGTRVRAALVPHGAGHLGPVCRLRWPVVDAGGLLRHRRERHRHHR